MAEIGVVPGGGLPWGDIVKAQTPFTDQVTASLLAQNAERRKYQQDTTLKADELMTKELANVRSVDIGSVVDAYGKWKNISMQMLNPKVQSDAKLYNQLQVQKNAALGQTMAAINRSAQLNAQAKELVAERKGKPSLYSDDFGDRLAEFNKTPMDKLAAHPKYGDLTNPDAFRYTGSQTDFGKLETTAAGQPKAVAGAEKVEKISDLQTRRTPTEFGNTPAQFFDNIKGQLAQHIPGRDAAAAWEAIPEQQRAAVDQQFAAIAPEKWQAMTGTAKPQVLAPADPNNPAENYAAYRAKIYAINAAPRAGTPRMETNEQAKLALQFDQKQLMEALKEGNREKLATMRHGWKQLDAKAKDDVMNGVVQDMLDQGKAGGPREYKTAEGAVSRQYDIPASTILKKEFAVPDDKGHPILVDAFRLSEDGQTVTPLFFKPGQTGNTRAVDKDISKPMTIGEFKARAAKAMFGVKESARETGKGGSAAGPAAPAGGSGITWQ
jgi:hypothetical protein